MSFPNKIHFDDFKDGTCPLCSARVETYKEQYAHLETCYCGKYTECHPELVECSECSLRLCDNKSCKYWHEFRAHFKSNKFYSDTEFNENDHSEQQISADKDKEVNKTDDKEQLTKLFSDMWQRNTCDFEPLDTAMNKLEAELLRRGLISTFPKD